MRVLNRRKGLLKGAALFKLALLLVWPLYATNVPQEFYPFRDVVITKLGSPMMETFNDGALTLGYLKRDNLLLVQIMESIGSVDGGGMTLGGVGPFLDGTFLKDIGGLPTWKMDLHMRDDSLTDLIIMQKVFGKRSEPMDVRKFGGIVDHEVGHVDQLLSTTRGSMLETSCETITHDG